MKKRITSLERFEYAFPATVRIDLQAQPAPKHQYSRLESANTRHAANYPNPLKNNAFR